MIKSPITVSTKMLLHVNVGPKAKAKGQRELCKALAAAKKTGSMAEGGLILTAIVKPRAFESPLADIVVCLASRDPNLMFATPTLDAVAEAMRAGAEEYLGVKLESVERHQDPIDYKAYNLGAINE